MDYSKLAPSLAMAFDEYAEGREALADHVQEDQMPGFVAPRDFAKPARVVVTLDCSPDADFSDLEGATGIEINAGGERVRTAIVPFDDLPRLTEHPGVERIAPAQRVRPLMDVAPGAVGIPGFRTKNNLTGKGVIIGVVDSGIDARHPAFAGRILRIWDQEARGGPGVPEGRYGIEYTGADLAKSKDDDGHGTHVAGIAAGSDSKYQGVAPEAEFVVVKTNMTNAGVIDGIQYVFRVAKDLGKAAVVNLSLGAHSDPHDGTDAMSKAIDDESGPGSIVCCAAGNEGEDNIHAQLAPEPGEILRVLCLHSPDRDGIVQDLWFNGWYAGGDKVDVAVAAPDGLTTPFQGVLPNGPQGNPNKAYRLGDWMVEIGTPGRDSRNGDQQITVRLRPPVNATGSRTWTLLVRGKKAAHQTTRVDVWALGNGSFSGPHARNSMTIGSPGTATSAITVAASTTKTRWTDIDGTSREASWLPPESIAPFSSMGPRRDGKAKPDLTAPGAMIVSAQSRDSRSSRRWMIDQKHVAMQGTSMASPFAAGAVALLLSQDESLDPGKVLSTFTYKEKPDGDTWGRGLIDFP
ncbi:S8 family serine peptidase [Streptomyces sp. NRRL F-2580]|uniref:S8 family serine peptidase n=1 Tax=Streptomyces sp. NRRL F-2580 TaxID=1463841 RepID=UPI0004C5B2B9|nr:S8 family serine peptidase [Streptomyces sp. NRRL F-2580]